MSRLQACFQQLAENSTKALVPYIVAGDPHPNMTLDFMHGMVAAGANIIELGLPFSDPMADGPSNQLGHERALKNSVTLKDVLALVKSFRTTDTSTPVVLMGYLNPIEVYGYEAIAGDLKQSGVDGMIIVDLPPEEASPLKQALNQASIDLIFLIAPTTSNERMKYIASEAGGYIYYVSLKGVTGAGNLDVAEVEAKVKQIGKYSDLPVTVGFGIKDGRSAGAVAGVADGVVVGSVLVDQCGTGKTVEEINAGLRAVLSDMRSEMDAS